MSHPVFISRRRLLQSGAGGIGLAALGSVRGVRTDVADPDSVRTAFAAIGERYGRVPVIGRSN